MQRWLLHCIEEEEFSYASPFLGGATKQGARRFLSLIPLCLAMLKCSQIAKRVGSSVSSKNRF